MDKVMNGQTANGTNTTNNGTVNGNELTAKLSFMDVSIKELIAKEDVQKALRHHIAVPDVVTVKKLRKAFKIRIQMALLRRLEL